MGKRFVSRSRQEWEALLPPETENDSQAHSSARSWLTARLEGYVQDNPDAPVTLAVPDRFLDILGDAPEQTLTEAGDRRSLAT